MKKPKEKWSREKWDEEFIKRQDFLYLFKDVLLKEETSVFGRFLLKENWLQFKIIELLTFITLMFGKDGHYLDIDSLKLENYTLGKLQEILQIFLGTQKKLLSLLKIYVKMRNKMTHKMVTGYYQSVKRLLIDIHLAEKMNDSILLEIEKIEKEIKSGVNKIIL